MVLRARKRIEEGEEITIHYVSPMQGLLKRKQSIEEEWYFKCRLGKFNETKIFTGGCRCPRCCDVTEFGTYFSAMKCSHCHEGLILPETAAEGKIKSFEQRSNKYSLLTDSLWRCRFCSNPFEANFIGNLVPKIISLFQSEPEESTSRFLNLRTNSSL